MATRNELTANDALKATSCKGMQMLKELGVGYQPKKALMSVRTFQDAWNGILETVKLQSGILLPSRNKGILIVDGLYGAQTATAVNNFIAIPVPMRAADVPPWAAKSEDALMAMCPPAPPLTPIPEPLTSMTIEEFKAPPPIEVYQAPPPVVVTEPIPMGPETFTQPAAPAPPPAVIPVAATPPPQLVVQPLEPLIVTPMPTTPSAPLPTTIEPPKEILATLSSGPVVVQTTAAPALTPDVTIFPSRLVLAPKAQGYGPMAAIGLGVLAVGGVLTFWMLRRPRRIRS